MFLRSVSADKHNGSGNIRYQETASMRVLDQGTRSQPAQAAVLDVHMQHMQNCKLLQGDKTQCKRRGPQFPRTNKRPIAKREPSATQLLHRP
jgi:hypothetical protein